jgi:phage recombination protein Bet
MSNDLTTRGNAPAINWTPQQLVTIKQTVARDTNELEFNLFIEYAKVKGLDPFSKQVVAIVFNKDDDKKRQMSIVTTQEGLRVLAARCGDYHPAKPGDTEFVLTDYEIERKRLLAEAAKVFNIKERTAKLVEINENMPPDAKNPAGIVLCRTTLWKAGQPVAGETHWDEFAPLRPSNDCFEWVDSGETWKDSGKPKKRRQIKKGVNPKDHMVLDDSGQWYKMAHVMIGKCATMQALRAGWPAIYNGVYAEEEFDRARVIDLTASEYVEMAETERRAHAVGMAKDEFSFVSPEGDLHFVPSGQYADHVIRGVCTCKTLKEFEAMKVRNREGMNRYWAMHKDDALLLKKEIERIAKSLPAAEQAKEQAAEQVKEPA